MSRSMHAVVHIVHAYSTWQLPKTADLWKAIVDRKHLFDGTDLHDSVTYSCTCTCTYIVLGCRDNMNARIANIRQHFFIQTFEIIIRFLKCQTYTCFESYARLVQKHCYQRHTSPYRTDCYVTFNCYIFTRK